MPSSHNALWYVARGEQQVGPITFNQLEQFYQAGKLRSSDLLWSEGLAGWKKASAVYAFDVPKPPPIPKDFMPDALTQTQLTAESQISRNPNPIIGILQWLSACLILGALAWWAIFYHSLAQATAYNGSAPPLAGAIKCIFLSGGDCGVVIGLAQLLGYTPYQPIVFWVGLVGFGVTTMFRMAASD